MCSCFRGWLFLALVTVAQAGCGSGPAADVARDLPPVAFPDFSAMEEPARSQMQKRHAALSAKLTQAAPDAGELATEFGAMGKLLMAATHLEAAEDCFVNARTLAPADPRWPYYLGHIYRLRGPLTEAVSAFERVLELRPDDVAAMIWLGEVQLSEGRADQAASLFARALSRQPESAAALFGAGRAALAQRDHAAAAKWLEAALAREPRATAAHYPLAMAYRALADSARAETHLGQQGPDAPRPADPLMQEIDELLQTAEAYNIRGGQALDRGDWPAAADAFRKGLAIAPDDLSLRHRLGTALAQLGDAAGAAAEFEEVIRRSPSHARAHFSLGVLLNDAARHQDAIARFTSALQHEPGYVQARVQLAGALARSGRPGEAVVEYGRALEADPSLADAAYGRGMAFVRLRRWRDAREQFAAGAARFADRPLFKLALARLLAAAPDAAVRDGRRAMAIVDEMMKGEPSLELAETAAMGLAELGRFEEAAAVQRDVLTAARQNGLEEVVRRAAENLALYERREPCRRPFADGEIP